MEAFKARSRSLLRDADVEEEGRIRIGTRTGCHLTSDIVLEVLGKREAPKKKNILKRVMKSNEEVNCYNEPVADIRHLISLTDRRFEKRKRLRNARTLRRMVRRAVVEHQKRQCHV